MALMLFGIGGSWVAVFGKLAAASYYVLGLSSLVIAVTWAVAYRRGSLAALKSKLALSTVLTAVAWGVALNEARINDFLIMQM